MGSEVPLRVSRKGTGGSLFGTLVPALAAACLPKCPACVAVYTGALAPFLGREGLFRASLLLAGVALAALFGRCRTRGTYAPLAAGALATGLLVLEKRWYPSPLLAAVAAGTFVAAALTARGGRKTFSAQRAGACSRGAGCATRSR